MTERPQPPAEEYHFSHIELTNDVHKGLFPSWKRLIARRMTGYMQLPNENEGSVLEPREFVGFADYKNEFGNPEPLYYVSRASNYRNASYYLVNTMDSNLIQTPDGINYIGLTHVRRRNFNRPQSNIDLKVGFFVKIEDEGDLSNIEYLTAFYVPKGKQAGQRNMDEELLFQKLSREHHRYPYAREEDSPWTLKKPEEVHPTLAKHMVEALGGSILTFGAIHEFDDDYMMPLCIAAKHMVYNETFSPYIETVQSPSE